MPGPVEALRWPPGWSTGGGTGRSRRCAAPSGCWVTATIAGPVDISALCTAVAEALTEVNDDRARQLAKEFDTIVIEDLHVAGTLRNRRLATIGEAPALAAVVEVQLLPDPGKRWSWPVYVSTLRARLRCPTVLLVVCVDAATAAWCAAPIELGNRGSALVPEVLSPDLVPVVTDPDQARPGSRAGGALSDGARGRSRALRGVGRVGGRVRGHRGGAGRPILRVIQPGDFTT